MEKVRLGRTGLVVTRLGWGGIPIQRVEEDEAVSVIRAVIDMGVDLLDTARAYTNSEHRVGLALAGVDRPVVLSTKSQMRTAGIYDEVHESLRQLNVKKIDIYHLHAVSDMADYEKAMAPGGAYEGLSRARDEGLIDHIGLSSHNLDVLARAVEEGRVAVIMACYGFLEPDAAARVFPLARANDVGVLAMKPFSGGVVDEAGSCAQVCLLDRRHCADPWLGNPREGTGELEGLYARRPPHKSGQGVHRGHTERVRPSILQTVRLLSTLHRADLYPVCARAEVHHQTVRRQGTGAGLDEGYDRKEPSLLRMRGMPPALPLSIADPRPDKGKPFPL